MDAQADDWLGALGPRRLMRKKFASRVVKQLSVFSSSASAERLRRMRTAVYRELAVRGLAGRGEGG